MGRKYDDDDGRTIADMSDLPDVSALGSWSGLRGAKGGLGAVFSGGFGRSSRRGNETKNEIPAPEMDGEERRMYVLGMLKASLGIGMIYIIAFAVFIGLLLFLWR